MSFARNDSILVDYYRDEARAVPLEKENCRLDPGDAIYASIPLVSDDMSPLYQFSEIQVRELDTAGDMKGLLAVSRELPGLVYRIPSDYTGTEIAVIPLGEYRNRTVTLNASAADSAGTGPELENGVWEINGKKYGNGTVQLHPMESCQVTYDYSFYKDDWYFAGSSPESYWDNSNTGTITFLSGPSDEEHMDYSVKLHTYGAMQILNGVSYRNAVGAFLDGASTILGNKSVIETQNIIDLIQVNGITVINNFSDTEILVPKLKVGDEILIRVPAELKLIAEGVILPPSIEKNDSREYRFLIPDTENMAFRLSVSRRNIGDTGFYHGRSVERGKLTVFDSTGIAYTEGSELPAENERITVEIVPDNDFCIYGKNVSGNVYRAEMNYGDYMRKYEEILASHPIRPGIMVNLDTEDDLGECVFWSDNSLLNGRVMLREGQDLQFDYILAQDSGYEIILSQEDREHAVNVWSPYAANRQLEVTEEMNGATLRCRDFLTLREGVQTDAEDPF